MKQNMELLSPAGGMPALQAAIQAGANAAYGGLKHLNARTGAQNFTPDELKEACRLLHEKGAKFYLTLNTELSQRELGLAARSLAVAEECGVDAVLIRDPALLLFKPFFPKLQFHFSTQAGITTLQGAQAGKALGLTRVVLARELSMEEIQVASSDSTIETEVFVQGALCFSCSGRCLLSSWGGGRSGNRGECTSPCRLLWTTQQQNTNRLLSMHDLCALEWLQNFAKAGVASLKIEGRLKSPAWVSQAVSLYRKAIDGLQELPALRQEADALGNYTGRQLTDGYLNGHRNDLTGDSRRISSALPRPILPTQPTQPESNGMRLAVSTDEKNGVLFRFTWETQENTLRLPPRKVPDAKRAVALNTLLEQMREIVPAPMRPLAIDLSTPELSERLFVRSAANGLLDELSCWLRKLQKEDDGMPRGIRIAKELQDILSPPASMPRRPFHLNSNPDTVRFNWNERPQIPAGVTRHLIHLFPMTAEDADTQSQRVLEDPQACAALPQVFYQNQVPAIRKVLQIMKQAKRPVEINNWDAWQLAQEEHCSFFGGEGMHVLNALAATKLQQLGFESVTASCEIDEKQLTDLAGAVTVPISITVFGRPPLMITRAEISANGPIQEPRKTVLLPAEEGAVTILRPEQPMDWRKIANGAISADHLIVDLRTYSALPPPSEKPFLFNYNRRLR